jgi:DNA modification methylase
MQTNGHIMRDHSMNKLYFGDNLAVMSNFIADESVDLIYLDPPFNSKRDYSILYKTSKGAESEAQLTAFKDTWAWSDIAQLEYLQIRQSHHQELANRIITLHNTFQEADIMAYLVMMTRRLMEMHRVLKPTGSIFLHCDSTAVTYLDFIMQALFGVDNRRNLIIWQRTSAHNDARNKFGEVNDTILFYAKSPASKFNVVRTALKEDYVKKFYRHQDPDGRRYRLDNMAAARGGGMAAINKTTGKPNGWYEWMGYQPPERGWRYKQETMQKLHDENRIYYPANKAQRPQLKRYLDENKGGPVGSNWTDIPSLNATARESLGYPTQKPLALLERIISCASNPGDVVLDPFCGCGTAVHAAQNLGRQWLGIDITHLAIALIETRLRGAFPETKFETEGVPKDIEGARDLAARDKYQFQWWACALVGAQPRMQKGADGGIDGWIHFTDVVQGVAADRSIIVSVKGGGNVTLAMLKELVTTVERRNASIGLFVTLTEPTKPMIAEAAAAGFYSAGNGREYPRIQILTIEDLLTRRKRPEYVDFSMGEASFKQTKRQKGKPDQLPLV